MLLSLSGEITVAIKKGLQKSAKEILEHEDDLRKTAKNADEAKQIDDVIDELERMASKEDDLFRKIEELFDLSGGRLLTKKELDLLKDFLWERYKVRLKLVDVDHSLKNKLIDWNKRSVLGSFRKGPPPELYLRANNASELTVFHEMVHLKYWFEGKPKIHFAQEEIIVWKEIWITKDKWTSQELLDSYYYVEKVLRDNKLNSDLEKLVETFGADIKQIKINQNLGIK